MTYTSTGQPREPVRRAITIDYDSDDARMLELQRAGYKSTKIAQLLANEGRVKNTRWAVIKRRGKLRSLLGELEDEDLDDELTDWHEGEDVELRTVTSEVEQELQARCDLLLETKFAKVAERLAESRGKKKFSANACRQRYSALKEGTETPPFEQCSDKSARRQFCQERIASRRAARRELRDATKRAQEQVLEEKVAKEEVELQRHNSIVAQRELKQEIIRHKAEKLEAQRQLRAARKIQGQQEKIKDDWQCAKRQAEDELYSQRSQGLDLTAAAELGNAMRKVPAQDRSVGCRVVHLAMSQGPLTEDPIPTAVTSAIAGVYKSAVVPRQTLENPRYVLTRDELVALCKDRGLDRPLSTDTHAKIVDRLAEHDMRLTDDELTTLLREAERKIGGTREVKVRRLQLCDAANSNRGRSRH